MTDYVDAMPLLERALGDLSRGQLVRDDRYQMLELMSAIEARRDPPSRRVTGGGRGPPNSHETRSHAVQINDARTDTYLYAKKQSEAVAPRERFDPTNRTWTLPDVLWTSQELLRREVSPHGARAPARDPDSPPPELELDHATERPPPTAIPGYVSSRPPARVDPLDLQPLANRHPRRRLFSSSRLERRLERRFGRRLGRRFHEEGEGGRPAENRPPRHLARDAQMRRDRVGRTRQRSNVRGQLLFLLFAVVFFARLPSLLEEGDFREPGPGAPLPKEILLCGADLFGALVPPRSTKTSTCRCPASHSTTSWPPASLHRLLLLPLRRSRHSLSPDRISTEPVSRWNRNRREWSRRMRCCRRSMKR